VPQGTLQHEEARNTKDKNEEATPEIDDRHAITGKPKPSRDQVHVLNAPVLKSLNGSPQKKILVLRLPHECLQRPLSNTTRLGRSTHCSGERIGPGPNTGQQTTSLTIPNPLHQISYSCIDPRRCPSCRTCHIHTTRQANAILHTR
jgi:hypothetical protein